MTDQPGSDLRGLVERLHQRKPMREPMKPGELMLDCDGRATYCVADGEFHHDPNYMETLAKHYAQQIELNRAAQAVCEAERDFREGLPSDWEGDPLSDAVAGLRAALARSGDVGGDGVGAE